MTDNVKLDLYNAVKTALQEITEIKNVVRYNSQQENEPQETRRQYPQAWIEFSSVEWPPSLHKANNSDTSNEQKGNIELTVHLAVWDLRDDDDSFSDALTLTDKIYRKLTMLEDENFTPLQRVSEIDDINQDNVRDWQITFTTMVIEAGVSLSQVDAAPVTVKILQREA